jgi:hypothetical protein
VDASAYFARPGPRIVDSFEILAGIMPRKNFPNSCHAVLKIRALFASGEQISPGVFVPVLPTPYDFI